MSRMWIKGVEFITSQHIIRSGTIKSLGLLSLLVVIYFYYSDSMKTGIDVLLWNGTSLREFHTSTIYKHMHECDQSSNLNWTWKSIVVQHVSTQSWKILHYYLATRSFLNRQGLYIDLICPYRGLAVEFLEHPILSYQGSLDVCKRVSVELQVQLF